MSRSTALSHRTVVQARGLLLCGWDRDSGDRAPLRGRFGNGPRKRARFADKGVGGVGMVVAGRRRTHSIPAGTVKKVVSPDPSGVGAAGPTHHLEATAEDIVTKVRRGRATLPQIKRTRTTRRLYIDDPGGEGSSRARVAVRNLKLP
jgi:hypothetical protein